jgi:hypothetical protein
MKKYLLFIAFILFAFALNAQRVEYAYIKKAWDYNAWDYSTKKDKEKIANAKVTGYICTFKNKKKEYVSQKVNYDSKGNGILSVSFKTNGSKRSQASFTYSSDNKILIKLYQDGKGNEYKKITFAYDKNGNITEESLFKNGKLKAKTTSTFDSTRVLESYFYKNGSPDFKRKWVYTYYPDKSKKSSVIYNSKREIKYTWNYECKPEGQLERKQKDTTTVCKNEEVDKDGNRTITNRRFNAKGKAYKEVIIYNKDNKMILYSTYMNNSIIPTYKCTYDPSIGNIKEWVYSNSKGKEKIRCENSYDGNNNLNSSINYHKGKLGNKWEYKFNAENLKASETYYKKDNSIQSTFTYEYLFQK